MPRRAAVWVVVAAVAALALAVVSALTVGPGDVSLSDAARVLGGERSGTTGVIVWELRLPRIILAATVGAALGTAGALTQGLFRNPLASPGVLGIASGSAAAVVLGFALGLDEAAATSGAWWATWATPVLAFAGAMGVLVALFAIAGRSAGIATLLLTGVALTAVLGAATTCILALNLDQWELSRRALAWMLGSFDARGWSHVAWTAPIVWAGVAVAISLHRNLDLLFLGEESAASLGVDRDRMRLWTAATVAILVGTATAAVGTIVFVGLIVPHLARRLVGPRHAILLPASAITGALLLLGVDTISRSLAPTVVAPGALTSLIGGAFFLVLLRRFGEGGRP
jgi:iron complex transport system permease protein